MTGTRMVFLAAAATAVGATIGGGPWLASPAAAQDIFSLQARVMQLEAKVREITTFKLAEPTTVGGTEALRQRIQTLELTVAEMQNALTHLRDEVETLKKAQQR